MNSTTGLLPDEAIDYATKFGFDDYSTALASIISDEKLQTPFTVAIHGDWGSGKTSLMKTIAKKLESSDIEGIRVKNIWFSAWEFEKIKTPLWSVFLNRVIMELQEMVADEDIKGKIKAVGQGIIGLAGEVLLRRIVGIDLDDVEKIKDKVWEDIKRIDSLRDELSKYIKEALEKDPEGRKRLVIFIDDLDRCLPNQCVEIFESIKLFLGCQNCVFIVGVDKDQIRRAFESRFGGKGEKEGLTYVEKFIQLQFDLPRKTPDEIMEFLLEHASEQLKRNPKTVELISKFIEPNPRKIKRWLNSVIFLEKLFRVKQEKLSLVPTEIDVSIASIWLFLKSFFPDFAIFVESDLSVLNTAIRVASGKGTKEDKQKIGDFTIDKRLADFLSLLKPNYDENQLKDIVYLSKLTPALYVSVLPKDILRRIAEMTQDDLLNQLKMLGDEGALSLGRRVIDKILLGDSDETLGLFELLNLIFENLEVTKKADLLNMIVESMFESPKMRRYFSGKLETYTTSSVVREAIKERGLLDKMIALFAKSTSFNEAKQNSAVLLNFNEDFTSEQVKSIAMAFVENDQISASWGAQSRLRKIFSEHKRDIPEDIKTKVEKTLGLSL